MAYASSLTNRLVLYHKWLTVEILVKKQISSSTFDLDPFAAMVLQPLHSQLLKPELCLCSCGSLLFIPHLL
jgi:hypothetical protein